jgi:hypothetical protein
MNINELERAAAEVADHAVRLVHAGDHAEGGQFRLARTGEHLDLYPDGALGKLDEAAAVLGVAAGGRGDRYQLLHAHRVA